MSGLSLREVREAIVASTAAELVERFYHRVWNKADETEARSILASDFRFRGSLGPELRRPDGFIAYMRSVRSALADFTCWVDEMIADSDRAAAQMTFERAGNPLERRGIFQNQRRQNHRAVGAGRH